MTPPSDLQRTVDRLEIYREAQVETNKRIEKKIDDHIVEYRADRKGDKVLRGGLFVALITSTGTIAAALIAIAGSAPK